MTMNRKAELEAQKAAIEAELKRLNAEPDYERYLDMRAAFYGDCEPVSGPLSQHDKGLIVDMLNARNHDPDVIELVRWARTAERMLSWASLRKVLAPFAAIKDD